MFLTSGDIFLGVLTPAIVVAFTGVGLTVSSSPLRRVGPLVFLAGLAGILAPMTGITEVIGHYLHAI